MTAHRYSPLPAWLFVFPIILVGGMLAWLAYLMWLFVCVVLS